MSKDMVLAGITGTAVYVCICEELVHLVSKLGRHEYFSLLYVTVVVVGYFQAEWWFFLLLPVLLALEL
jgi:TctA family transporter